MRLIDADRIVYSWHIDADGEEHDGVTLQSIIRKMPTIDAVEVVRCRDCKHWYQDADSGMACEFTNMSQPEDGFCNWAEIKDGEQDETHRNDN